MPKMSLRKAAFLKPTQIRDGILCPRQDDHVASLKLRRILRVIDGDFIQLVKNSKVRKIGHMRQTHDGDVKVLFLITLKALRLGVLLVDMQFKIRHHAQYLPSALFFQYAHAAVKERTIAAEFIDQQAAHAPAFLFL